MNALQAALAIIVVISTVLLAVSTSIGFTNQGITSLMGGNETEGVINNTENLSYGDSTVLPSSRNLKESRNIHEGFIL
jgi:hypothetical protein